MPNRKLKAAIIGAGHFAYRVHIPVLKARPEVVLDSVCRRGEEELRLVRDEFGFAFATQDWREILDREIDIAVIATPHHLHYEQAAAFLRKGCDVLVEKPMCLDPAQAWDLVGIAREAGRHLVVSHGWHYKAGIDRARDFIARIGRIEHVMCHMASFTRSVFAGDGGVDAWRSAAIQPQAQTWQDPDAGGGYAYGQLSHALGLLFWLTDLRTASVEARTWNSPAGIDLHDAAAVTFSNGATGVFSGSCGVPSGHGFELEIRLYGSEGAVTLDIERETLTLKLPGGMRESADPAPGAWRYSCEGPPNTLVDLALGYGRNESDGDIGARTVEALAALVRSARSGASVELHPGTAP
jgi:predicted dehydrogenase